MAERAPRILVADDDESSRERISSPLRRDGCEIVTAADGEEALERFREGPVDLVVLALELPRLDGLECCRRLRAAGPVGIIAVAGTPDEDLVVDALEAGADDCVARPVAIRELRGRVRALLRRSAMSGGQGGPEAGLLRDGDLRIDPLRRSVSVAGEPVELTFAEFELLQAMASSPGRVWSREQLLGQLWGGSSYRDPRTVDVHVRNLRRKVEPDPGSPQYVQTVRGVGYRFREAQGPGPDRLAP